MYISWGSSKNKGIRPHNLGMVPVHKIYISSLFKSSILFVLLVDKLVDSSDRWKQPWPGSAITSGGRQLISVTRICWLLVDSLNFVDIFIQVTHIALDVTTIVDISTQVTYIALDVTTFVESSSRSSTSPWTSPPSWISSFGLCQCSESSFQERIFTFLHKLK